MRRFLAALALSVALPVRAQNPAAPRPCLMDGSDCKAGGVSGTGSAQTAAMWIDGTTIGPSGDSKTTDAAPLSYSLQAQSAWSQATGGNQTGAVLNLAGGIGTRFYTVVLNTGFATKTLTLTPNGGSAVVLTAGTDFALGTDDTAPQLAVTAANIAAAINAHGTLGPLMTASGVGAIVYIDKKPTLAILTISTNAGAPLTATSGADGDIKVGGVARLVYDPVLVGIYFGPNAGVSNTGASPTQVGFSAGQSNTGADPTQVGYAAGYNNTGASPTQVGVGAGQSNTGANPTQVGVYAGYSNTGAGPTQVGRQAGTNELYGHFAPTKGSWAVAGAGGAGTVGVLARTYRVLYTLGGVDTDLGTNILVWAASAGFVSLDHTAVPIYSGPMTCTARKLYKYQSSDRLYYLVGAIADNVTTTYSDTQADATYGTVAATPANTGYFGVDGQTWGANEFALGSSANPYQDIYLNGRYHLTPGTAGLDVRIHGMGGNGTDKAGGPIGLYGGLGTGAAAAGPAEIKTGYPTTTGTTQHVASTRAYIPGAWTTLTESSATPIATLTFGPSSIVSAEFLITVEANDGTDFQNATTSLRVHSIRKATGNTSSTIQPWGEGGAASAGTLACTYSLTDGASAVVLNASCVSSLTQTTLRATFHVMANGPGLTITQN